MVLTITVRIEAETKEELHEHLTAQVAAVREHFDGLHESGHLGEPTHVRLHYIVVGGKYCGLVEDRHAEEIQQPEEPVAQPEA